MTRTTKWLHLTLAAAALGLWSPALRAAAASQGRVGQDRRYGTDLGITLMSPSRSRSRFGDFVLSPGMFLK